MPRARFELRNEGGQPVRIRSVEPSCGCMEAQPSADKVPPRGRIFVDVAARSSVVAKTVTVVLETDSPVTPHLLLTVELVPSLHPPFLLLADGDLSFLGSFDPSESRVIRVFTVAKDGEIKEPRIEGIPDFLAVDLAHHESRPYGPIPGTTRERYDYRVHLQSSPPPGPHQLALRVVDPWDAEHAIRIPLFVRLNRPVRAVPELVVLGHRGKLGDNDVSKVLIEADNPLEGLHFAGLASGEVPLQVWRLDDRSNPRRGLFEIRLTSEITSPQKQTYPLTFLWNGGKIDVPIMVVPE
ncbi:MAG TPA: DUF1573 domain-containing protein [Isosphaeraceae bacterium]|nr:DUF1573 domain-containing protein [Isosphaeraceae bacterium]